MENLRWTLCVALPRIAVILTGAKHSGIIWSSENSVSCTKMLVNDALGLRIYRPKLVETFHEWRRIHKLAEVIDSN